MPFRDSFKKPGTTRAARDERKNLPRNPFVAHRSITVRLSGTDRDLLIRADQGRMPDGSNKFWLIGQEAEWADFDTREGDELLFSNGERSFGRWQVQRDDHNELSLVQLGRDDPDEPQDVAFVRRWLGEPPT